MSRIEVQAAPSADGAGPLPPPAQASVALTGLKALTLVARLHHVAADPAALQHQLGKSASYVLGADDLLLAAKHLGLSAKRSRSSVERLALTPLSALALMRDGSFVDLAQCDAQRVLLQRFGVGDETRPMIEPLQTFAQDIPVGWWHCVESLEVSVSVSFTDFRANNQSSVDFPR